MKLSFLLVLVSFLHGVCAVNFPATLFNETSSSASASFTETLNTGVVALDALEWHYDLMLFKGINFTAIPPEHRLDSYLDFLSGIVCHFQLLTQSPVHGPLKEILFDVIAQLALKSPLQLRGFLSRGTFAPHVWMDCLLYSMKNTAHIQPEPYSIKIDLLAGPKALLAAFLAQDATFHPLPPSEMDAELSAVATRDLEGFVRLLCGSDISREMFVSLLQSPVLTPANIDDALFPWQGRFVDILNWISVVCSQFTEERMQKYSIRPKIAALYRCYRLLLTAEQYGAIEPFLYLRGIIPMPEDFVEQVGFKAAHFMAAVMAGQYPLALKLFPASLHANDLNRVRSDAPQFISYLASQYYDNVKAKYIIRIPALELRGFREAFVKLKSHQTILQFMRGLPRHSHEWVQLIEPLARGGLRSEFEHFIRINNNVNTLHLLHRIFSQPLELDSDCFCSLLHLLRIMPRGQEQVAITYPPSAQLIRDILGHANSASLLEILFSMQRGFHLGLWSDLKVMLQDDDIYEALLDNAEVVRNFLKANGDEHEVDWSPLELTRLLEIIGAEADDLLMLRSACVAGPARGLMQLYTVAAEWRARYPENFVLVAESVEGSLEEALLRSGDSSLLMILSALSEERRIAMMVTIANSAAPSTLALEEGEMDFIDPSIFQDDLIEEDQ